MTNLGDLNEEERIRFFLDMRNWDINKLMYEAKKRFDQFHALPEGKTFAEGYFLSMLASHIAGVKTFKGDGLFKFKIADITLQDGWRGWASPASLFMIYLIHGKVFTMTEQVYSLLENTKNKIFPRKQPFDCFAIDQKIETSFPDLYILFAMFFNCYKKRFDSIPSSEPIGSNYLVIGQDKRDKTEFWVTGSIDGNNYEYPGSEALSKEENTEIHTKVQLIYANFLDYLNHPYAKQTLYKFSENDSNRIKRGKFPRNDNIVVDIKSEFLQTVNLKDTPKKTEPYKFKFWVRGHFKHFRNRERFKKIYALGEEELKRRKIFRNGEFLSRFILPFIKGTGKLKNRAWRAN